ncbi:hypothetical protein KP509_38G002800 [Ceratopteris richardii]|uniref:Uncharacterized protein n=1 Tax=Ceratopteris richardii TaxID=49495 RepID=A0A8T2Q1R3_CERRI|nr:hypothetical protein KP509_38G002800 [Ceratopteris richardii]
MHSQLPQQGSKSGEVEWQPGPNRVFDTTEGFSSVVVKEEWNNVTEESAVEIGDELKEMPENNLVIEESEETLRKQSSALGTEGVFVQDDESDEKPVPDDVSITEDPEKCWNLKLRMQMQTHHWMNQNRQHLKLLN